MISVLGLDPGSERTGYAVLAMGSHRLELSRVGVWNLLDLASTSQGPKQRPSLGARLEALSVEFEALLKEFNPAIVVLEKAVHFKNVASSHVLSEVRGVLRLGLHRQLEKAESRLIEVSPTASKRIHAGSGAATKSSMIRSALFRFPELALEPQLKGRAAADMADAVALALIGVERLKSSRRGVSLRS